MALAIFDLDETLISCDSDHEWGKYIIEQGLVDRESHQQKNDIFYQQYKNGELDVDEYFKFACGVLATHPIGLLDQHLATFVNERIKPLVLPKAINLLDFHRNCGNHIMMITSTIEFITRPIADLFDIQTLIAPIPKLNGDRYTGSITGIPSFGSGKVKRLKEWLKYSNHNLDGSFFYSDSHNDLPLLRHVENPVAVDPDKILRKEAVANKWPIITLR